MISFKGLGNADFVQGNDEVGSWGERPVFSVKAMDWTGVVGVLLLYRKHII